MRFRPLFAAAIAASAFAIAAPTGPGALAQQRSCVDTLAGMPEFSRFVNAIVHTHVVGDMRNANAITVFAPTNDALGRMDPGLLDRLFPRGDAARQADPVLAPAAIGAHVVQGRRDAQSLRAGGELRSVAGTPVSVTGQGEESTVVGAAGTRARITRPDIPCSNGIIHGVDGLLIR
jgi:uncharacterized surface protein with fasciclin (FAS1) repeats